MSTYRQGIKDQGDANRSISDTVLAALTAAGFTEGTIADRTMAYFHSLSSFGNDFASIVTADTAWKYESTVSEDGVNVPLPTGMQDGDWTIVVASQITSTSAIGATPAGWSVLAGPVATVASNTSSRIVVYAKKWVSGDPTTVTVVPSVLNASTRWACAAIRVRGVDPTTLLAGAAVVQDDSGTDGLLSSGSITAASTVGIIIYYGRTSTNVLVTDGTWTAPGGGEKVLEVNTNTNSSNPNLMILVVPLESGVASDILTATATITGAVSVFAGGKVITLALNHESVAGEFTGGSTISDYFRNYLGIKPDSLIDPSELA